MCDTESICKRDLFLARVFWHSSTGGLNTTGLILSVMNKICFGSVSGIVSVCDRLVKFVIRFVPICE